MDYATFTFEHARVAGMLSVMPPTQLITSLALASGLTYYLIKKRIYTIRLRQTTLDSLRAEATRLEKEKTLVMFESLKQQLNPHFLFNSLASLDSLIWENTSEASRFLETLSWTYRYILKNQDKALVPLGEELEFAGEYVKIQQKRFLVGLHVDVAVDTSCMKMSIAPVTIRNLIENAIKHNVVSDDAPLRIRIYSENEYLIVRNILQRKRLVATSNRQGLKSLAALYSYLTPMPVVITELDGAFVVKVPLVPGNAVNCTIEPEMSHESNHY